MERKTQAPARLILALRLAHRHQHPQPRMALRTSGRSLAGLLPLLLSWRSVPCSCGTSSGAEGTARLYGRAGHLSLPLPLHHRPHFSLRVQVDELTHACQWQRLRRDLSHRTSMRPLVSRVRSLIAPSNLVKYPHNSYPPTTRPLPLLLPAFPRVHPG